MRYWIGFVCVVTVLLAAPASVSAQEGEEGATKQPNPDERVPVFGSPGSAAPDDSPPAGYTQDSFAVRYTVAGAEKRSVELDVRRSRISVGVFAAFVGVGAAMVGAGVALDRQLAEEPSSGVLHDTGGVVLYSVGAVVATGGFLGMVFSGFKLRAAKRKVRRLDEDMYRQSGRIQWDLAQSRLAF